MPELAVDVVVVGMGPGGEDAAERLAAAGLSVAGVDDRLVGGECPYWGCVPSKMMIRAANLLAEGRRIPGLAGAAVVQPDWAPVARRIRVEATDDWDDTVAVDRFTAKGGLFFRGHGRLTAPDQVTVGDQVLRARRGILLNPGTEPSVPPVDGLAGTPFWTNREAIETTVVPGSLVVLGGSPVGVELSQVFARFGARVTVLEGSPHLVPAEEPESGELLREVFARDGIDVRTGAAAAAVRHDGSRFTVTLSGAGRGQLTADALLVAAGRRTDLAGLGAGVLGVDEAGHTIPVDDHMRAAPGVWAIGDVTGHGKFTHMSMYQAGIAVADILGQPGSASRVPRGAPGHVHRPGNRLGRADRGAGPRAGLDRTHRVRQGARVGPRLDPPGGQRRVHQAGGRRRPRHPGGRHVGRAGRRRSAQHAHTGRTCPGSGAPAGSDDLRVSHLPRGYPVSGSVTGLTSVPRPLNRQKLGRARHTAPTAAMQTRPPDQAAKRGVVTLATPPARNCPAEGPTL